MLSDGQTAQPNEKMIIMARLEQATSRMTEMTLPDGRANWLPDGRANGQNKGTERKMVKMTPSKVAVTGSYKPNA